MSNVLDKLKKYKESCLDDDGYTISNEAENLVFESVKEIELLSQKVERLERVQNIAIHIMSDKQNEKLINLLKPFE